jgi:hypothetical protein
VAFQPNVQPPQVACTSSKPLLSSGHQSSSPTPMMNQEGEVTTASRQIEPQTSKKSKSKSKSNHFSHLNLHVDQPRYEGFGVVIVTVAIEGSAQVINIYICMYNTILQYRCLVIHGYPLTFYKNIILLSFNFKIKM